jgi:hypothetical protein
MKKVQLENRLYSVATMDEYTKNPDLFSPKFTAIEAHGTVMPIRSRTLDDGPGYYYQQGSMCCRVVKPENPEEYSADKIIDYTNPKSIADILYNNELIKDIQSEIMTTSDNIFYLKIGDEDTPEMKALKTAINTKQVDKKQYEDRFDQFQNDMRLLKGSSITLAKLISICGAFDISAELTLRDKEDAPNPMNTEITVDLTEGRSAK